MTRARALLSLSLITSGAMLGGLGLSGYYEPRTPQSPVVAASVAGSMPVAPSQLAPQGRLRFVAIADDKPAQKTPATATKQPKTPAKALAPASAPPARPRPEAKERPEPKVRRQHVATPWPWSIFGD